MSYTVEYYEMEDGTRPAEDFILAQDIKMRAKLLTMLEWRKKVQSCVSPIQSPSAMASLRYGQNKPQILPVSCISSLKGKRQF